MLHICASLYHSGQLGTVCGFALARQVCAVPRDFAGGKLTTSCTQALAAMRLRPPTYTAEGRITVVYGHCITPGCRDVASQRDAEVPDTFSR